LEGRVYWGDVNGKAIKSCKYDGADRENFLLKDIGAPEGLAVDWISRNVYWTDAGLKRVEVVSIDLPRRRKILVSENLMNPRGIAIHPSQGKLFWSDWNRDSPKIERANMDGSSRTVFVKDNIQLPNSLAVDVERDELCWADAGTKTIECIGIRNGARRTVVSECSYPFGLALSESHYYWTDWATNKVESASRPSGKLLDALEVPLGGSGSLFGIVAVPDKCPRLSNPCQSEDACPEGYLCLPNGRNGRSCVCPDNSEDSQCNDII
jgi:nidogen (entactin)